MSAEKLPARNLGVLKKITCHPTGAPSLYFLLFMVVLAVFAKWIAPFDPAATSVSMVFAPASTEHLLGGDAAGRDVASRLLVATSYSLAGGLVVASVAAILGVTGGLVAGYFGGWIDNVGSWFTALTMSVPAMVVLLAARAAFGPSMWLSMAIFGVIIAPTYYRVVYNSVRAVRNELYIDAARTSGLSTPRIIARHVFLAVRAPVILLTASIVAAGIGMMAALDFLGLGAPETPTWGQMLSEGFYQMARSPYLMLWPSLMLGLTMIALVLFGAALRDELEGAAEVAHKHQRARWSAAGAIPEVMGHPEVGLRPVLLQVSDLAVAYPRPDGWRTVVHGSRLTVRQGEIHGLVGESGSGKSQTAFAVLGLLGEGGRCVAGSILFDDKELIGLGEKEMNRLRGRRIAYVPQDPMSNLDPAFTVGSQFTDPLRTVLGMSGPDAKALALDLLKRVGIPDPLRTFSSFPHQLSGGMAQRVLIAAAVASAPDLLIADEPTTALDVTVQAEVLDLLRELREEMGMSILIVTHSFGVVADLCDHVSVMQSGIVVESGPTAEVFSNPLHPYTQDLFAAIPKGLPRAPLVSGHPAASQGLIEWSKA